MINNYTNDELIKTGSLSGNPLIREIVYRWKWYISINASTKLFLNGNISKDELSKRIDDLKGVIE
jgi:hypothetical protein